MSNLIPFHSTLCTVPIRTSSATVISLAEIPLFIASIPHLSCMHVSLSFPSHLTPLLRTHRFNLESTAKLLREWDKMKRKEERKEVVDVEKRPGRANAQLRLLYFLHPRSRFSGIRCAFITVVNCCLGRGASPWQWAADKDETVERNVGYFRIDGLPANR